MINDKEKVKTYVGFAIKSRKIKFGVDDILKLKNVDIIIVSDALAESGMKKIQLTFSVKEVFFKDITGEFANFVKGDYYETSKRMAHLR